MSTASTAFRERSPRSDSSAPAYAAGLLETDPEVTLQDLLDGPGGIAAERVRLHPTPGTATEQDLLAPRQRVLRPRRLELIDGTLVEKVQTGWFESTLASVLTAQVRMYLEKHRLGIASCGGDAYIKVLPQRVRVLDMAFVRWEHIPGQQLTREPCPDFVIDLAVEVLSASNTLVEMRQKRQEFFEHGTRIFWIVDPAQETVTVYHSVDEGTVLTINDEVSGEDVLPGFRLGIREWFQMATAAITPPEHENTAPADDAK